MKNGLIIQMKIFCDKHYLYYYFPLNQRWQTAAILNECVMNISDNRTDPTNVIRMVERQLVKFLPDICDKIKFMVTNITLPQK